MSVPSGTVYLVKNALVDRSYSHTIDFKNSSEQLAYWSSLVKYSLSDYSYIRRSSQFIKVDKTLDELQDVNYLFYRAKEDSKLYYCFVTNKEYLSDTVTAIYFEVDVLQTRMFEYEVKPSYVLQEHCDRWDANLKPIYSRTDEGLDYGSEYTIEAGYKVKSDKTEILNTPENYRWFLAIVKPGQLTDDLNLSNPDRVGIVNPYLYFLLPQVPTIDVPGLTLGIYFKNMQENSGVETVNTLATFMDKMSNSELGNFVQQIVKLPYIPFEAKVIGGLLHLEDGTTRFETVDIDGSSFLRVRMEHNTLMKTLAEMDWDEGIKDAMPTAEQWAEVKANPYTTERDKRFESKLLTHPYRYNLLTDWKNNPIVIKNEYIGGDKIKLNYSQGISFNSPARYWIEDYKKDPEGRGSSLVQLTPEEAPVITDAYYTYMLQNKNQIQADRTNAIVSGVSSAVMGGAGGMVGGALGGPVTAIGGALMGGASGVVNSVTNYQNMVRSQNAKQQDLKNIPDTIINPNDANFSYFDDNEYISFYRYKICCEFENLLADTFAMTGYTVKRVKVPNLKTRVRFNYVKTVGANIIGSFDQNDLATLRAIFDNGVTFWHYNTVNFKPLDYSLENIETKLL